MSIQQSAELYSSKMGADQWIIALKPDGRGDFTARKFFALNPVCDIVEMAWSTSIQSRFTGHMRRPYSVAEHGMLVANLMRRPEIRERGGTVYEGLLHDAHEGYCTDLAAPWKVVVKDYRAFEQHIESAMRTQYLLPPKISDGVKYADWLALFIEAEVLLVPGITKEWFEPEPGTRAKALELLHENSNYYPVGFEQCTAFNLYLQQYERLKPVGL